jgi:hypothetical protein
VIERGFVLGREFVAFESDVRRAFDLLLCDVYLEGGRPDRHADERNEGKVSTDPAFLDGSELWFVAFDVEVDVLQRANALTVPIDQIGAAPLG